MRWPWIRPERRAESLDYAAKIADAFEAAAAGTSPSSAASAVAAAEAAAGCWSRAFAVGMPTPAVLTCIGRELILHGEIVFDIRMSGASLVLIPVPRRGLLPSGRRPRTSARRMITERTGRQRSAVAGTATRETNRARTSRRVSPVTGRPRNPGSIRLR